MQWEHLPISQSSYNLPNTSNFQGNCRWPSSNDSHHLHLQGLLCREGWLSEGNNLHGRIILAPAWPLLTLNSLHRPEAKDHSKNRRPTVRICCGLRATAEGFRSCIMVTKHAPAHRSTLSSGLRKGFSCTAFQSTLPFHSHGLYSH